MTELTQSGSLNKFDIFYQEIRPKVLHHLKPLGLLSNVPSGQVVFMQTAAMTSYSKLVFKDLINLVPFNERGYLSKYLEENKGKTLVSFQEDSLPMLTYAYEDSEID
ncbi:MAG: hypothetical protein RPR91_04180 [Colwellia sp.]